MANVIELVIGLVAPIGTDIDSVSRELEQFFSSIGMDAETIQVSKWLAIKKKAMDGYQRYLALMDAGDNFRRKKKSNDAVAGLAMGQIIKLRGLRNRERPIVAIVRQLKTPEEVSTFRKIYGNRFVALACYSSRPSRVENLTRRLANEANEIQVNRFRSNAEDLIRRDEQDSEKKWGQNVRKAFPISDLFVNVDDLARMKSSLRRMLEILFSHPFHTPTKDEFGMNQAEAAALRSSALGRQVGAVIMTPSGDVVSIGTNEVPKAGGGLYWEDDIPDRRDYTLGYDTNDLFKEKLLGEIVKRMANGGWLVPKYRSADPKLLIDLLMYDANAVLSGAQIDNIIEFGRCVHAEMASIVDAARRGVSVNGCDLFSTTFPCHECARHIVAAGVRRVIYRVPYPKSLVRELYPDSIDVEGEKRDKTRIAFEPFVGVAPRRFGQLFEMPIRKSPQGDAARWEGKAIKLNLGDYFPGHGLIKNDEARFVQETLGITKSDLTSKARDSRDEKRSKP